MYPIWQTTQMNKITKITISVQSGQRDFFLPLQHKIAITSNCTKELFLMFLYRQYSNHSE